jgi:hypothetical protein
MVEIAPGSEDHAPLNCHDRAERVRRQGLHDARVSPQANDAARAITRSLISS